MRICILQHESDSPAGYFADWAQERGHRSQTLDVPSLTDWPAVDDYDLIVSLGSECSVHASDDPWIGSEIDFVRQAHEQSAPVLGICFGAQLLAAALGGRVRPARQPQAQWREIPTSEPDLIPPGPWLRWHEDVFELPPGSRLVAGADDVPLAFVAGSSVGVQFHPEVNREIAERWIDGGRERIVTHGIDEAQLRAEMEQAVNGARERAFALLDGIATACWRAPDRRTGV